MIILLCIEKSSNIWFSYIPFLIGILGFISAILSLIYSNKNSKRNLDFLRNKSEKDRDDSLERYKLEDEKDRSERQKAYNRVLGSFLKVYHSYIKHQYLYSENGVLNIPDEYLVQQIENIDDLNIEIKSFKNTVNEQAEIIPELTIYLYEILDLLGRFELVVSQIPMNSNLQENNTAKLLIQRAHSYAVQEILDDYFSDLIEMIAKKAKVSNTFLKEIKDFNSNTVKEHNIEIQNNIMKRYLESISRQTGQDIDINNMFP